MLDKPRYVLAVDDVDVGGRIQCFQPPRLCAENRLHSENVHPVPFHCLALPRRLSDLLRCNDKHLTDGELRVFQVIDRRQRDDRLTKPHVQKEGNTRIGDETINAVPLICVRL